MEDFLREKRLEALAHLSGLRSSPSAADSKITPEDVERATLAVDSLEGMELLYYYCKSICRDAQLIGDPKSVFAFFSKEHGTLQVFTKDEQFYDIHELPCITLLHAALEGCIGHGAIFHRGDGETTCVFNDFSARGAEYTEAAMRAWLKKWLNTR